MIPRAEKIKPKEKGKSDFFSWKLYRYASKRENKDEMNVFEHEGILFIGSRTGSWARATFLRELCSGLSRVQRWAFPPASGAAVWNDITEQFWADYMRIGVCAIHGDFAHKFIENGNERVCEYCKKKQVKVVELVEKKDGLPRENVNE